MTIITAIEQARDTAKKAKYLFDYPTTAPAAVTFSAIQGLLPRLHTTTVNQPTARRIVAELVVAGVSFAVEPEGLKYLIAVNQEAATLLDASRLAHTGT